MLWILPGPGFWKLDIVRNYLYYNTSISGGVKESSVASVVPVMVG